MSHVVMPYGYQEKERAKPWNVLPQLASPIQQKVDPTYLQGILGNVVFLCTQEKEMA